MKPVKRKSIFNVLDVNELYLILRNNIFVTPDCMFCWKFYICFTKNVLMRFRINEFLRLKLEFKKDFTIVNLVKSFIKYKTIISE